MWAASWAASWTQVNVFAFEGKLGLLPEMEDMKDVQAMAKRYCTLLKKSEDTLVEESLLQRDILGSKAQVPTPGTKRQASTANKQRRSPKVSLARDQE